MHSANSERPSKRALHPIQESAQTAQAVSEISKGLQCTLTAITIVALWQLPRIYIYTKILEVNLFAFAYRLFRRDFSPLDGTYCMGTHSFLQPYIHFVLIWEGFMNGQS